MVIVAMYSIVRDDGEVGGIGVHIAARVMATAEPWEILVSRTVHDLVTGSGIALQDRETHRLKGVEGDWQLLAMEGPDPAGRAAALWFVPLPSWPRSQVPDSSLVPMRRACSVRQGSREPEAGQHAVVEARHGADPAAR